MTVVSEIGEQWSPKIPPETTAPIINSGETPISARGRDVLIINAKVPQDVPVENAIKPLRMNISIGMKAISMLEEIKLAK